MCIILFAYRIHPHYELILAANRDEYYARPTAPAAFWEDAPEILAGRDLQRGGTWLGITRSGRFAAVTNFRDPSLVKPDAPSRGHLVSDFLRKQDSPADYLEGLASSSSNYNGFNLIAGNKRTLCYHSNKGVGVRTLTSGIYGVSNHLLDTAWPKVEQGKRALAELVRQDLEIGTDEVFAFLADQAKADDELLPQTGISLEYERALSPLFIATPNYGTRSSTLLLIDKDERVTFIERTFNSLTERSADSIFQFRLDGETS